MTYAIIASDDGHTVTTTRLRPGSAAALARKWADDGLADVRICWNGRSYALDGFLTHFVLTKDGLKPRNRDIRTW